MFFWKHLLVLKLLTPKYYALSPHQSGQLQNYVILPTHDISDFLSVLICSTSCSSYKMTINGKFF